MPFWKQSEDPWDRKPGKHWPDQKQPKEPRETPIDSLKQWNEKRKADRAERVPSPIPCPWCGKDMETGYIMGRGFSWGPGIPGAKAKWIGLEFEDGTFRIDTEGILFTWQTAWLCRDCKKIVCNMPDPPEYEDRFSARAGEYAKNAQEEERSGD